MTLQAERYRPRLLDRQIDKLLNIFGAVQIDGAKWCGKTWSGLAHANSITSLDDYRVRPLAQADPTMALLGDQPHLIDEWQLVPFVRDAVRHAIDQESNRPGQYLLTGSSASPLKQYEHSGAGRIAHLRMRPMSLQEQGLSSGEVSIHDLFNGKFSPASTDVSLVNIAQWICRGGWPASFDRDLDDALYIPRQYLEAVCEDNAPRVGKNPSMTRRIIASLARNNTKAATLKTLSRDMYADDEVSDSGPARTTTNDYIDMLLREFLIEELPSWDAPVKARNRMRIKPKRYFVDPSLAVSALGISPARILENGQIFGDMFENLVIRDLLVYTSAWMGLEHPRVYFYHDDKGLESDAIIELEDGRWGAIEIKLGENKAQEGAMSLRRVKKKVMANPYSQQKEPSFLLVIVGNGVFAYKTEDDVYVVPITLLGA
jgi:predicted AAA+ superfamily ATPase